ncbi:MAG: hypothetical protein AAF317_16975, partial [Pseudomonadota bacterium]
VICPECGLESDIVELITRRWDRPWFEAPKYTRICLPAAWALVGGILMMIVFAASRVTPWWFTLLALLLTLACWGALMGWVWRTLGGKTGLVHAWIAHAALLIYLLSLPLMIVTSAIIVIGIADTVRDGEDFPFVSTLISLILIPVGIALFVVGRRLERVVAAHCIRLYLKGPKPTSS